jgi:hypothetical protein
MRRDRFEYHVRQTVTIGEYVEKRRTLSSKIQLIWASITSSDRQIQLSPVRCPTLPRVLREPINR